MLKKATKTQEGFSLMELLVVLALMLILLSVSLVNYNRFGKDVELENAAYSLSLAIREAQIYGVNKKARSGNANPKAFGEDYGYGIALSTATSGVTLNNKTLVIFEDKGPSYNQIFDIGNGCIAGEECYSQILLTKGNYISDIRVLDSGGWTSIADLSIYFKRPNPDAFFKRTSTGFSYSRARIILTSPGGQYSRCVEVGAAGDISIKRSC